MKLELRPAIDLCFALFVSSVLVAAFSADAFAQRRDYMTDSEIEIVREAQDIDVRISVLTQMIDRRFTALNIEVGGWKQSAKSSELWGDPPKGTRIQLLSDIKKLLQKSIDDIDNLATHPSSAPVRDKEDDHDRREAKKDPGRFPAAVRHLAAAAGRYITPLKKEIDTTTDEMEKGILLDSIDFCRQILDSVGKLPPEPKKTKS